MKTFKDNLGRPWTLSINVDSLKRVRGMISINLLDALDGDLIEKLSSDPILLCDVVYALVKIDADKAGITDSQFGESMAGESIEHATVALLEELVSFFPLRRRQVLTKALLKFQEVERKGLTLMEKRVDAVDVDSLLANASATSGKQPEASA